MTIDDHYAERYEFIRVDNGWVVRYPSNVRDGVDVCVYTDDDEKRLPEADSLLTALWCTFPVWMNDGRRAGIVARYIDGPEGEE